MSKKVLAVYFTQSGQQEDIIENFTAPLRAATDITLEKIRIFPSKQFPFPWTTPVFFDTMPETVNGVPFDLEPFELKEKQYDLIILGYQPWFLSPCIPISSLLQHPSFVPVLKDTPVVTISGCRNMWINAQEKLKIRLKDAGAKLVGNIALVDRHNNYVSLVTILYWMLTGKKDKKWGIFPRPGVSDEDITNSAIFGETVKEHLYKEEWSGLQNRLLEQKALEVKYNLMFIERKAGKIFKIWAGIINKKKSGRRFWVTAFKYYLLIALCVAAPIILLVDSIFFKPFLGSRIKKQKAYYAGVALK